MAHIDSPATEGNDLLEVLKASRVGGPDAEPPGDHRILHDTSDEPAMRPPEPLSAEGWRPCIRNRTERADLAGTSPGCRPR